MGDKTPSMDADRVAALIDATADGDTERIEKIVAAGVNPNVPDRNGATALQLAIFTQTAYVVKKLISLGASVSSKSVDGYYPAHWAALAGKFETMVVLIEHEAQVNVVDQFKMTPLMFAALGSDARIVSFLLEKGADVNLLDEKGQSALDHAQSEYAQFPNDEIINLLEQAGAPKKSG